MFTQVPDYVKVSSSGGDITIVLPRGNTSSYAITHDSGGGDYRPSVPINNASPHKITVDSGGGNISIAEAS